MTVTNYIWDVENDSYLMETDESDVTTAVFTNEPNEFGGLISQRRGSNTSTYHYDGLGSTRELTDLTETATDAYIYSAFGETVAKTGTTTNPFRYIGSLGYYYDEETDEYYVRARMYDPAVARWTSLDPIGFFEGSNRYLYVLNNQNLTDPSGFVCRDTTYVLDTLFHSVNEKNRFGYCDISLPKPKKPCGQIDPWDIKFNITSGLSAWWRGGWVSPYGLIVQQMEVDLKGEHCDGTPLRWIEFGIKNPPPNGKFYEAWTVTASNWPFGSSSISPDEDSWYHGNAPCSKGTYSFMGTLKFLSRRKLAHDPWGNVTDLAGSLPTLANPPDGAVPGGLTVGWSDNSYALLREVTIEWDCCCPKTSDCAKAGQEPMRTKVCYRRGRIKPKGGRTWEPKQCESLK